VVQERQIPSDMLVLRAVCTRSDGVVPHTVGLVIEGGAGARPPTWPRWVGELRVSHPRAENGRHGI